MNNKGGLGMLKMTNLLLLDASLKAPFHLFTLADMVVMAMILVTIPIAQETARQYLGALALGDHCQTEVEEALCDMMILQDTIHMARSPTHQPDRLTAAAQLLSLVVAC